MRRILLRGMLAAAALLVCSTMDLNSRDQARADEYNGACLYRVYGQPDLFYNYYAWPSCGGVGAEMYPAPVPTPPLVGHTYYTYQPLMPHEFLYRHQRHYQTHYNGGRGLNRTHVIWW